MKICNLLNYALTLFLFHSCLANKDDSENSGKKILRLVLPPVTELDVHLRSDLASGKVLGLIHESLFGSNPYDKLGPLLPELATALPTISADGLQYTFKILQDVRYHPHPCWDETKTQRRTVRAEDFVTALKRLADPHFHSGNLGYWQNYIAHLISWRENPVHAQKTNYGLELPGTVALDEFTLQLTVTEPSAGHLHRLATLAVTPIPQELVECLNKKRYDVPLGTGPFRLKSFERGHRLVLEKNPEYRGRLHPLDPKLPKAPYLDGIVYTFSKENYNAHLQFLKGELDYLELTKDNQGSALTLDGILGPEYKKKNVVLGATGGDDNFYYLGVNHGSPLLAKAEIRRAFSLAIDRERFRQLFFTHNGIIARNILPPLHLPADYKDQNTHHDLEQARALLLPWQAQLSNHTFRLLVKSSPEARQVGEFIQSSMAQVGVKLEIEALPFNRLVERAMKGDYDLFYLAWFVGIPLVEEFLTPFQTGSTYNRFHYSSAFFDQTFQAMLKAPPTPEGAQAKQALLKQIIQHFDRDLPVIPLLHAKTLFVYWPWLLYYIPNETSFGAEVYYDVRDTFSERASKN
jgi:oligopeptide transport system substrate-binding protein